MVRALSLGLSVAVILTRASYSVGSHVGFDSIDLPHIVDEFSPRLMTRSTGGAVDIRTLNVEALDKVLYSPDHPSKRSGDEDQKLQDTSRSKNKGIVIAPVDDAINDKAAEKDDDDDVMNINEAGPSQQPSTSSNQAITNVLSSRMEDTLTLGPQSEIEEHNNENNNNNIEKKASKKKKRRLHRPGCVHWKSLSKTQKERILAKTELLSIESSLRTRRNRYLSPEMRRHYKRIEEARELYASKLWTSMCEQEGRMDLEIYTRMLQGWDEANYGDNFNTLPEVMQLAQTPAPASSSSSDNDEDEQKAPPNLEKRSGEREEPKSIGERNGNKQPAPSTHRFSTKGQNAVQSKTKQPRPSKYLAFKERKDAKMRGKGVYPWLTMSFGKKRREHIADDDRPDSSENILQDDDSYQSDGDSGVSTTLRLAKRHNSVNNPENNHIWLRDDEMQDPLASPSPSHAPSSFPVLEAESNEAFELKVPKTEPVSTDEERERVSEEGTSSPKASTIAKKRHRKGSRRCGHCRMLFFERGDHTRLPPPPPNDSNIEEDQQRSKKRRWTDRLDRFDWADFGHLGSRREWLHQYRGWKRQSKGSWDNHPDIPDRELRLYEDIKREEMEHSKRSQLGEQMESLKEEAEEEAKIGSSPSSSTPTNPPSPQSSAKLKRSRASSNLSDLEHQEARKKLEAEIDAGAARGIERMRLGAASGLSVLESSHKSQTDKESTSSLRGRRHGSEGDKLHGISPFWDETSEVDSDKATSSANVSSCSSSSSSDSEALKKRSPGDKNVDKKFDDISDLKQLPAFRHLQTLKSSGEWKTLTQEQKDAVGNQLTAEFEMHRALAYSEWKAKTEQDARSSADKSWLEKLGKGGEGSSKQQRRSLVLPFPYEKERPIAMQLEKRGRRYQVGSNSIGWRLIGDTYYSSIELDRAAVEEERWERIRRKATSTYEENKRLEGSSSTSVDASHTVGHGNHHRSAVQDDNVPASQSSLEDCKESSAEQSTGTKRPEEGHESMEKRSPVKETGRGRRTISLGVPSRHWGFDDPTPGDFVVSDSKSVSTSVPSLSSKTESVALGPEEHHIGASTQNMKKKKKATSLSWSKSVAVDVPKHTDGTPWRDHNRPNTPRPKAVDDDEDTKALTSNVLSRLIDKSRETH